MTKRPSVAVVGATGAVGREILKILEDREFPMSRLDLVASHRSAGDTLDFRGESIEVDALSEYSFDGSDIVLSSAGSSVSVEFAPRAVEAGAVIVDNTSAFRMDDDVPLVVPEVNAERIEDHEGIIANPNCSTIQMVVALEPIRQISDLDRVIVNTYQSASGAGQSGTEELMEGIESSLEGEDHEPETFSSELAFDVLPHIGPFFQNGFTKEEMKMTRETQKILAEPSLQVAATCVRVPVKRAHSEAITVDLEDSVDVKTVREALASGDGVRLLDDPDKLEYPTALRAEYTDDVWVGRLRRDPDREKTIHFWNVSDNLRKGAALNTVQIAEYLIT
jgi:aspartate-semialdehyde dehydrogenase